MIDHNHIGFIEGAGIAKEEAIVVDGAVIHDAATTRRSIGSEDGTAVDFMADHFMPVENFDGVGVSGPIDGVA